MRLITIVVLLALVGGGVYLFVFQKEWLTGLFKEGKKQVVGATPARTPDEALDKLKKFCKDRDYENAALYCGGVYGEQMKRGARSAAELGTAADELTSLAEKRGISLTPTVKTLFATLNTAVIPFPFEFDILGVNKDKEDRATARLSQQGKTISVELRREGEEWKVYFTFAEAELRQTVERLNDKGKDYVRALEKVKGWIMDKTIQTKDDLEEKLQAELKLAGN